MQKNQFTNTLPRGILLEDLTATTEGDRSEMLTQEQLSCIKVSGYKSIQNCDIQLGNINVLIGSNGAGKSNFISVFSFIQNILAQRLQYASAMVGVNALFYKGRKVTDKIGVEVFFGNNSYGFSLSPNERNKLFFAEEYFGYHGSFENRSTLGMGHEESLWQEGSGNKLNAYIQPILEKQSWRVYHFHDTGRDSRMKQESNIANSQVFLEDARNIAAFLYRLRRNYLRNYKDIVSTVRLIAPYFDDFVLEPMEENQELIILRWKQKNCDDIFSASQFSDGTLRFICLATLMLQPSELQPATIIVDEPELGLHPFAISVFAEMVRTIGTERQIIISTQSADLLSEFSAEDVIVVDGTEEGTRFKRLKPDELVAWLENDYTLGDLWKKNLLGGRLSR